MKLYLILNMAHYKPSLDESTPFWIMVAIKKTSSATMCLLRGFGPQSPLLKWENQWGLYSEELNLKKRNIVWTSSHTLPPSGISNGNEVTSNHRHNNPKTRALFRCNITHVHSQSNKPPNQRLVHLHEHSHDFHIYCIHWGLLTNYSSSPAVWTTNKYKNSAA